MDFYIAARPIGNMDIPSNENDWIVYQEDNIRNWIQIKVNKKFALELVKRWNTYQEVKTSI